MTSSWFGQIWKTGPVVNVYNSVQLNIDISQSYLARYDKKGKALVIFKFSKDTLYLALPVKLWRSVWNTLEDDDREISIMHSVIMASWNGNIFRVTGPLWGESTGHRWITLTKACDVELWSFLRSAPQQTVEQTMEMPVIWDTIALIIRSL